MGFTGCGVNDDFWMVLLGAGLLFVIFLDHPESMH